MASFSSPRGSRPPGEETNPASVSRSKRATRTFLLVLAATYGPFVRGFPFKQFCKYCIIRLNEGVEGRSPTNPRRCAHGTRQIVPRFLPRRKGARRQLTSGLSI